MDHKEFVSNRKSLLIAPAGYGKTHTIITCLEYTTGKQLILTHTHAGVVSLKEKLKKSSIKLSNCTIETITSFAQKYVQGFYSKSDIPDQENAKEYYPFIIKKATELIKLKPIRNVISASYDGLFVDEYQDCTTLQHNFILALSELLPTRLLGDPLQGIFNFNGDPLVDLNNTEQMGAFTSFTYHLLDPWRWKGKNEQLGNCLKDIRIKLEASQSINLDNYPAITVINAPAGDIFNGTKYSNKSIRGLLSEDSLLLIHPDTSNIHGRKKIIGAFNNAFTLVEAIDDKSFYSISKSFDLATSITIEKIFRDVCFELFNKTACNAWFNESGFKNKRGPESLVIAPIIELVNTIKSSMSFSIASDALKQVSKISGMKCYRRELFSSLIKSLKEANTNSITVYEAMIAKRNQVRRIGRKVSGKCIGTTLLTKGLEFDTVVVLNAHKFEDSKHLYVALTRASKRLIIITENSILSP